jgi:hypothetical protein
MNTLNSGVVRRQFDLSQTFGNIGLQMRQARTFWRRFNRRIPMDLLRKRALDDLRRNA